jgi:isoquinoline 1-oxidoreductase alpha subunit
MFRIKTGIESLGKIKSRRKEHSMINFKLNGKAASVDVPLDTPLLWVIREEIGLLGTKFGCGMALCGACTIHLEGKPVRSCVLPIAAVADKSVTTIEGLASAESQHPLQAAWVAANVPQCGYCQSGQIMSAVALLATKPNPSSQDIDSALSGNICRCGTYLRIRETIKKFAAQQQAKDHTP